MKPTFILLILCSFFSAARCQTDKLPKPTGKYFTGVCYLNFTDDNRKEIFDSSNTSKREITVKVWYPSDQNSVREPYMLEAESNFVTRYIQYPEIYKNLKTNSCRDVSVSSNEESYPVLIFSHGLGEHYSQNTILMEELASHGYVIFSIAHHYECKFSSYPDGRLIYIDMSNPRLQKIMHENLSVLNMSLFEKLKYAQSDEERDGIFREILAVTPIISQESSKYWADDIAFLIDQLESLNEENLLFQNKLDLNRVGVLGMSLGGLATSVICSVDERIKAGINIDGAMPIESVHGKFHSPFLYLNSARFLGCGPLLVSKSDIDCYSLTIKESGHYNFTDHTIYPLPMAAMLLGSIEGKRAMEITNTVVLSFFDKYLKNTEGINLNNLAAHFPEIEAADNLSSSGVKSTIGITKKH